MIGNNIGNPVKSPISGLDLSKGFKYESQDISDYQSSTPNPTKLDLEVEKNLNIKLPTGKLDVEQESDFIDSLDEDGIINFSKLINQGYSYNAAKALYENKGKYKDITAEGISKYEKKPSNLPYYGLGISGLGIGLESIGALNQNIGQFSQNRAKDIHGLTISPSIDETRAKQKLEANKIVAENKLNAAKESGVGVGKAQKTFDTAEDAVKNFRGMADTAYDYNIGEGILKNRGPESRGADARAKAYTIFEDSIAPALKKSKSTLNVQKMIDELADEIPGLSKLDPNKEKEYTEALKALKEDYSDAKYSKLSMTDSQTLKSGLQGRTPKKFFKSSKYKSEQEITDAYKELSGILSSKLKNGVQDTLTKEMGEEAAKLYKDYSNLIDYADKQAYASTKGGLKGGAGKFISTVWEAVSEPVFQKGGLVLGKAGELQEKIGKAIRPSTWVIEANNALKELLPNSEEVEKAFKGILDTTKEALKSGGGKALNTLSKTLDIMGKLSRPVDLGMTAYNIDRYQDIMATLPGMQAKLQWQKGNVKGKDYEGWTEADWENIGLGKEDIKGILESDNFKDFVDSTSWGISNPYEMYYSLIK